MNTSIQKRWKEYLAIRDTLSSQTEIHTPPDIKRLKKLDEIEREVLRLYMFFQVLNENKQIALLIKTVLNVNEHKELVHIQKKLKELVLAIQSCKKAIQQKEGTKKKKSEEKIAQTIQHVEKIDLKKIVKEIRRLQKDLLKCMKEFKAAEEILTSRG